MPTLLERVTAVWNKVRAGETETRAHFAICRDHIRNGEPLGQPFKAKQHYFQIVINEMFLVSEMLGHASKAITLDVYSHVLPNLRDHAAAAMEDALS
jgi:integrase